MRAVVVMRSVSLAPTAAAVFVAFEVVGMHRLSPLGHDVGFHQPSRKRQAGHPMDPRFFCAGREPQGTEVLTHGLVHGRRKDDE
jgi:hypothetical protein